MKDFINEKKYIVLLTFIFAFCFIPVSRLDGFALMPGNIGDARLNNYFLENVFRFLTGKADSLWHLPFFYPFPYVLGFSDNLFGTAPIYILARLFTRETDTSFQIWFYFGYIVNFLSAYYALRRLNGSVLAAAVGSLIFTFALPTTAHASHAQLHYRFGLPLAIVFLTEFYNHKKWNYLLISGAWLVWQFYAGVYMGFFTLLLMATMSMAYICISLTGAKKLVRNDFNVLLFNWCAQPQKQKAIFLVGAIFLLSLLILLFYPYLQVSRLYGATRNWNEIASMLPRVQSYLMANSSFLWANPDAKIFADIPARYEHKMFIGLVPLALAFAGFFVGGRKKNGVVFPLMTGMLGIAIILTLYVGGFSLWYFLHKLPIASGIRVMTRLDQAFLFPIAYLAVIAIDELRRRCTQAGKIVAVLILPLLIFEAGMTSMSTSTKDSWRQRIENIDNSTLKHLPENSILFFAQHSDFAIADDLDAMWVASKYKVKTMNGYSAALLPGHDIFYGDDCSEIFKRVSNYLIFINQSENMDLYRELVSRVVPIGFNDCDSVLFTEPPSFSISSHIYTEDEFSGITYSQSALITQRNKKVILLTINNASDHIFSAHSSTGNPIKVAWRFIDAAGQPLSDWENRKYLPYDIPSRGSLKLKISLNSDMITDDAKSVQISLVQEGIFWVHDIGLSPLTMSLN